MRKKWFRVLFAQRVWVALLIILQAAFFIHLISTGSAVSQQLNHLLTGLSLVVSLYIIAKKDKGAYKLTWVFLILMFPVLGGALYLLYTFQTSTRRFEKSVNKVEEHIRPLYSLPQDGYQKANERMPHRASQIRYLQNFAGFPVYDQTRTAYYSPGEAFFEALIPDLESAEHYIFLEFFIVQEGKMWDTILEILIRKAREGVTVRLIYDDMGCFLTLPKDYKKQLAQHGIECIVFNPFRPLMSVVQNNRDHRKIASIDGKVAYTGGINLADEYINAYEKHGHWKDSALRVEGKAAWSLTLIFLEMWALCRGKQEDFEAFYPWKYAPCNIQTDGFVQPYADSPMDLDNVGEHVYLQIINSAKDYVYITTPYLIIDDSMLSALILSAKSGVDVRIITPRIWDKRLVHMTTRSYYRELTRAGVKIYEYTRGFMHAKTFVSDDNIATVGTTNLDFRSLYLHFECGVMLMENNTVHSVKDDFIQTLDSCQLITQEDCKAGVLVRLFQEILRLFAPLL